MTTHSDHNHISLEFGEVLKRTITRFKKAFMPLALLFGITMLLAVAALLTGGLLSYGLYTLLGAGPLAILIAGIVLVVVIFFTLYAMLTVGIMNIKVTQHPTLELFPLFKKSWSEVPRVFTAMFFIQLGILGGFFLGILPGIWLGIVLMFAFTVAVLDNATFKTAISKSAFLVKNNFWNLFAFVLFIFIVNVLLGYIPFIGTIIGLVFSLFTTVLTYELYVTLMHNKGEHDHALHSDKKLVRITQIFAVCGFVGIILLTIGLTALLLLGNFS